MKRSLPNWILPLLLLAIASPCAAGPYAFFVRGSGVFEGPQHTFKEGFEWGAGVEKDISPRFALGLGIGQARADNDGFERIATSGELHGRMRITDAPVHPFLEIAGGVYSLHGEVVGPGFVADDTSLGPGLAVGAGLEWRSASSIGLRGGASYHFFSSDLGLEGGSAEDFFTIGVTLELRPGAH